MPARAAGGGKKFQVGTVIFPWSLATDEAFIVNLPPGKPVPTPPPSLRALSKGSVGGGGGVEMRGMREAWTDGSDLPQTSAEHDDFWGATFRGDIARVREYASSGHYDIDQPMAFSVVRAHGNSWSWKGMTALDVAAYNKQYQVAKVLLELGARLDTCTDRGRTPLHFAGEWSASEVGQLLLEKGADPNVQDDFGVTPLHLACVWGHQDVISTFLRAGADPGLQDVYGQTPMHWAAEFGTADALNLMIDSLCKSKAASDAYDYWVFDFRPLHKISVEGATPFQTLVMRDYLASTVLGRHYMGADCIPKFQSLFRSSYIGTYLEERWNGWGFRKYLISTVVYSIFLIMWLLVSLLGSRDGKPFSYKDEKDEVRLAIEVIFLLVYAYYVIWEMHEAYQSGKSYILNQWNWVDIITQALIAVAIGFRVVNHIRDHEDNDPPLVSEERHIIAIASLLLWLKVLRYLVVFRLTGPFMMMLWNMAFDTLKFLFIFIVFLVGFANAFFVEFGSFGAQLPHYHTFTGSMMRLVLLTAGDFEFDSLQEESSFMATLLFILFVIVAPTMLVNLLIAMMSNTFQRVYDESEMEYRWGLALELVRMELNLSMRRWSDRKKKGFETSVADGGITEYCFEKTGPQTCTPVIEASTRHTRHITLRTLHKQLTKMSADQKAMSNALEELSRRSRA